MERTSNLSNEELMFTCPASLSHKNFQKLREELVQFIKKFYATIEDPETEELACLNIDWFEF